MFMVFQVCECLVVEPGGEHFMGVLGLHGTCLPCVPGGAHAPSGKEILQGYIPSLKYSDLFWCQSREKERHPKKVQSDRRVEQALCNHVKETANSLPKSILSLSYDEILSFIYNDSVSSFNIKQTRKHFPTSVAAKWACNFKFDI